MLQRFLIGRAHTETNEVDARDYIQYNNRRNTDLNYGSHINWLSQIDAERFDGHVFHHLLQFLVQLRFEQSEVLGNVVADLHLQSDSAKHMELDT